MFANTILPSITELSPILFVINGAFIYHKYHSEHFCAHRLSRTVRRRGAPQATASGVGKLPRHCQTKFAEGWAQIVGQVQVPSIDSQSKGWAKSCNFVAKSFLEGSVVAPASAGASYYSLAEIDHFHLRFRGFHDPHIRTRRRRRSRASKGLELGPLLERRLSAG